MVPPKTIICNVCGKESKECKTLFEYYIKDRIEITGCNGPDMKDTKIIGYYGWDGIALCHGYLEGKIKV